MAYDKKYRRRVLNNKDEGHTFAEVHEAFGVNSRSYYGWKAEPEEKGKFENRYPKSRPGKINPKKLRELAEKHPDWSAGIRRGIRRLPSGGRQKVQSSRHNP
jgi:transposase